MKELAAYLLAALAGKETPAADDVEKILASVELKADEAQLKAVIDQIAAKGMSLAELQEAGKKRMATMPCGGAAPAAGAAAPAGEKKEEKKEKSEEEAVIGGFMMDSSSSDEDSD